jgi:hypothetical protein
MTLLEDGMLEYGHTGRYTACCDTVPGYIRREIGDERISRKITKIIHKKFQILECLDKKFDY